MFLFWTALIVAFDQATKLWAKSSFVPGGPEMAVGLGFSFTYVRNPGAAFGLFRDLSVPLGSTTLDGTLLLGLVSAAVATGITVYLARNGRELPRVVTVALTLILGGAIGNMIDRLWRGYVVDFIHFQQGSFDFAVFNVADSAVVAGAGLLMLAAFLPAASPRAPADAMPGDPAPPPQPELEPADAPEREPASGSEAARRERRERTATEEPTSDAFAPLGERERARGRFDRSPEHRRELDEPDLEGLERDPSR